MEIIETPEFQCRQFNASSYAFIGYMGVDFQVNGAWFDGSGFVSGWVIFKENPNRINFELMQGVQSYRLDSSDCRSSEKLTREYLIGFPRFSSKFDKYFMNGTPLISRSKNRSNERVFFSVDDLENYFESVLLEDVLKILFSKAKSGEMTDFEEDEHSPFCLMLNQLNVVDSSEKFVDVEFKES